MRKFRNGIAGRDKWWFLLKGQETVLKELEAVWESVSLQTKWKLEPCTKPTDGNSATQPSINDATPTPPPGPAADITPTSPSPSPPTSSSAAYTPPTTLNATSETSQSQSSSCNGAVYVPDDHVTMTQDSQPESETAKKNFLPEGLVSLTQNN